jgi:hypothetical protein
MPGKRLYTEKDISAILRRATEMQRTRGRDDTPGLSLEELQQVAEDVGIEPDLVRRAALEMEEGETPKSDRLFGGPVEIDREWMIDGELTDERWEDALGEIRRTYSAEGEVRREGRTWDWVHRDQMGGRVHVSMSPAGSKTRFRISYGMKEWLWLHVVFLSIGIGGVAVQYAVLSLGALAETGIGLLVMLAFFMIGWLSFRGFTRRQDRKVQQLLNRLDALLSEPEGRTPEPTGLSDVTADDRLDVPALDQDLLSDESVGTRGRRERS